MAKLSEIVARLDSELRIDEIPDYSGALNGLQLQNGGEVTRVASAVDATLPVIRKAIEQEADLLIVHHGMFWQGAEKITGKFFEKIQLAMESGLAIYSSHIPLDIHSTLGNNAILAKKIADVPWEPFFDWKGISLGLKAELDLSVGEVATRLREAVGRELLLELGEGDAGVVGVITGGAGSELKSVYESGIQTFISGEGPHWAHGLAEEIGKGLLLGGHYATETFGVKALGQLVASEFVCEALWIDHPSGL